MTTYAFVYLTGNNNTGYETNDDGQGDILVFNNFSNVSSNFTLDTFKATISNVSTTVINTLTIPVSGYYMLSFMVQPINQENICFSITNNDTPIGNASFNLVNWGSSSALIYSVETVNQTIGIFVYQLNANEKISLKQIYPSGKVEFIEPPSGSIMIMAFLSLYLINNESPWLSIENNSSTSISNSPGEGQEVPIGDIVNYNNITSSNTNGSMDFTLQDNSEIIFNKNVSSNIFFSIYLLTLYNIINGILSIQDFNIDPDSGSGELPEESEYSAFSTIYYYSLSQNKSIEKTFSVGSFNYNLKQINSSSEPEENIPSYTIYTDVTNQLIGTNLLTLSPNDTLSLKCLGGQDSILQNQTYGSVLGTNASLTLLPLSSNYAYLSNNTNNVIYQNNEILSFNSFESSGSIFKASSTNVFANTTEDIVALIFFTVTIFQTSNLTPQSSTSPRVTLFVNYNNLSVSQYTFSNQYNYGNNNTFTITGMVIATISNDTSIYLANQSGTSITSPKYPSSYIPGQNIFPQNPISVSLFIMQI